MDTRNSNNAFCINSIVPKKYRFLAVEITWYDVLRSLDASRHILSWHCYSIPIQLLRDRWLRTKVEPNTICNCALSYIYKVFHHISETWYHTSKFHASTYRRTNHFRGDLWIITWSSLGYSLTRGSHERNTKSLCSILSCSGCFEDHDTCTCLSINQGKAYRSKSLCKEQTQRSRCS